MVLSLLEALLDEVWLPLVALDLEYIALFVRGDRDRKDPPVIPLDEEEGDDEAIPSTLLLLPPPVEDDDDDTTRALAHPHEVESSLPRFLDDFQPFTLPGRYMARS